MNESLISRFRIGIYGGLCGGMIAIVGFLILSPPVDSLFHFVILRIAIGAAVAMAIGPTILAKVSKKKSD